MIIYCSLEFLSVSCETESSTFAVANNEKHNHFTVLDELNVHHAFT